MAAAGIVRERRLRRGPARGSRSLGTEHPVGSGVPELSWRAVSLPPSVLPSSAVPDITPNDIPCPAVQVSPGLKPPPMA